MGKNNQLKATLWEKKKNAIMRNYRKTTKRKGNAPYDKSNNQKFMAKDENRKTFFHRAMEEYKRKEAEKERIKQIKEAERKEQEEALKKYKQKRREKFKKLTQKTKKGQPVMRGHIEVLLEEIEEKFGSG